MIFLRWGMLHIKWRVAIIVTVLVLLVLHLLNLVPSVAEGAGAKHPRIQFFEYEWTLPNGTVQDCIAPAASSRIMGSTITIPGGAECVARETEVDTPS